MRKLVWLGVALVIVGIVTLGAEQFSAMQTQPALKAGPAQVKVEETHDVAIPTVASIIVVLVGAALVIGGRR